MCDGVIYQPDREEEEEKKKREQIKENFSFRPDENLKAHFHDRKIGNEPVEKVVRTS